jgi:putative Holliday junction resolvase
MKYLGIDYGEKRIGLSLSDELGCLAFPFKIIINDKQAFDAIHNICGEENVIEIILGHSVNSEGQDNLIMIEVEKIKQRIEKELGLLVHLEKEFMTTIYARDYLEKNDIYGKGKNNARQEAKKKTDRADAVAAALILQRYLDRKNN